MAVYTQHAAVSPDTQTVTVNEQPDTVSTMPATSPKISAIAFDMDGLMFDTENLYTEVVQEFLTSQDVIYDVSIKQSMMGLKAEKAIAVLLDHHDMDMSVDEALQAQLKLVERIFPNKITKMPGLDNILEAAEIAGVPKALTTSSKRAHIDFGFDKFELHDRFEFKLGEEDVSECKPSPEIYQKAAAKFGISPSEMLVLEDSPAGTEAGVKAGAVVVSIPAPEMPRDRYEGAHMIVERLDDPRLLELIAK